MSCKMCGRLERWVDGSGKCAECKKIDLPDDVVNHPKHYTDSFPLETRYLIEALLNAVCESTDLSPWQVFCLGNMFKYRLRAGEKGSAEQDINKANKYREFFQEGLDV